MADYLFEGIVIEILHRLPVKTLLRCTTVCKSWYSLITSPQFISSHLKFASYRTKSAPSLLVRRFIKHLECYELYSDSESFTCYAQFEFPFKSMNSFFTIVGSCNGLLCLSDDRVYYINTIIIWNPSIKKSVFLPKPNMIYSSCGSFTQCLGFGFDPLGEDYKVVRITYVDLAINPQIEVYKLSSGVWQDMSYLDLEYVVYNRSRHVYLNGALHWLARDKDSHDLIVLFDLSLDVFKTTMLPIHLGSYDHLCSQDLVLYKGCLSLVQWKVSSAEQLLCVWVMQDYGVEKSWTKSFGFDLSIIGNGFVRPLWIRKGGVVGVLKDGSLAFYDQEGEVEGVGVRGSKSDVYQNSLRVDSYMSSLVLLGRGSCFSDAANGSSLMTGDVGTSSGSDHEDEVGSVYHHNVEVCWR